MENYVEFDHELVGRILEKTDNVTAMMDGTHIMIRSTNPNQPANNNFVAIKNMGQWGSRFGPAWNNAGDIFHIRGMPGQSNGLRMSPVWGENDFFIACRTTIHTNNNMRWVSSESAYDSTYNGLQVKYWTTGRGSIPGCVGSIALGHYSSSNHWLASSGEAMGSIKSVGGSASSNMFHCIILKMGANMHDAYYKQIITGNPAMIQKCCMKDFKDPTTAERCGAVDFLEGTGKCDNWAKTFCGTTKNKSNKLCGCMASPLKDSTITVGCDQNCTRAPGIYVPDVLGTEIDKGCPYIECTQSLLLTPEQRGQINNLQMEQDCGVTKDDGADSGRTQTTTVLDSDGNAVTDPTITQGTTGDSTSKLHVEDIRSPTVRLNDTITYAIPDIVNNIPDIGVPHIDNFKGLSFALIIMLIIIVLLTNGEPEPPAYNPYAFNY
jgi:hypothetical protein